ncbi:uncharacterized protein KY384_006002 [Bacidia gigantensis]|uniref:uncharacterized protein n=1 Tax=Bacidia gigantensis TaxID=2732470 RepID=UPI001D036B5F|nr:uncharacterized protein KY384_006002 [Bacidia gigantensis]KAG8529366.1 hypothetical protein KY384_006002 [Bacidia gigantensis]
MNNPYPTPTPSPPEGDGFVLSQSPLTVLASSRAVVSSQLTPATITISRLTGKITSVTKSVIPRTAFPAGTNYTDYSPHILLPGIVDAHVHLNEPGRTEWEGFYTGTRAAASGGVTTVIDMPLNAIPPTTTIAGLKEKVAAAQGKCWVDVGFYGGIIPGNVQELRPLVAAGVRGFKGFLIDSGVPEFPAVSSTDISAVLHELKDQKTTVMFHAEMIPPISDSVGDDVQHSLPPLAPIGPLNEYKTFLASRPSSFETYAIAEIISLAHLAPALPLHIVHLSAIEAIPLLREARSAGIKITAETCFHYLSLVAEKIQHGDTRHKCCPPIRTQSNQDGLWSELLRPDDSVIKTIVSDHSPCTPELKLLPPAVADVQHGLHTPPSEDGDICNENLGNFFSAWGGVSSVGLGLPILWTEAKENHRDVSPVDVARWCSENTAKQVGLDHCKGKLETGHDGDICIFDDSTEWVVGVGGQGMLFRNKVTAYQGKKMTGKVRETWLKGQKVWDGQTSGDGFGGRKPAGHLLLEPRRR